MYNSFCRTHLQLKLKAKLLSCQLIFTGSIVLHLATFLVNNLIRMGIQIIKRSGLKEPYYQDKIERVVVAAGLKPKEGKLLAENITAWIKNLGQNEITSEDVRNKVSGELAKVNRFAKNAYDWYEKSKDTNGS